MNEDDRKKYLEELMQPHIPLRVLQEIRQKISDIPIPYDDKDTLEHQYGEGLIRDAVIEIIDKHIKEYEE